MYVTTIIPIIVSEQPWKPDFTLFVLSRFFLIYSICILFDLCDREDDKEAGIRSIITFLSKKNIFTLFVFSTLAFAIATLWMLRFDYPLASILVILIPGIIVAGLYHYAKNNFSDLLYYFVLDGLMALSAILMLITGI
jgi:4-hydroxybenzoate polyprenyltransferase